MYEELADSMKVFLASSFHLYLKTQFFHWNVEGPNFYQLHILFEDQYKDIYEAVDKIAEQVRTLDSYAPGSFTRYSELSVINDETEIPNSSEMLEILIEDNRKLIEAANNVFLLANNINKQDIANFMAERIESHSKHVWMLKSSN